MHLITLLATHTYCNILFFSAPSEVKEILSKCEALFLEDNDSWEMMKVKLERFVHPNHLFLFALKERYLLFRRKKNDTLNEEALKHRIEVALGLLDTLDKIDPGFTPQRGRVLQALTKDRIALMKWKNEEGDVNKKCVIREMKELSQCTLVSQSP